MQPQFNDTDRQPAEYLDVLHIYRARIVNKPDPGDDRLQVRIIPHMVDITETDLLPTWPPFFKGQVIVGKTEKIDQKNADYVWVAALPDFSQGFILGLANSFGSQTDRFVPSYNYKDVVQGLMKRGVIPSYVDYKNLHVQFWTDDYLEMVDFRNGDKYIIQSNGSMFIMERNQIYFRVGSGDSSEAADSTTGTPPFSAIRMSRKEISIVSPSLRIRAGEVTMGEKGLYIVGSSSPIPIHVEGATLHPQSTIKS